MKHICISLIRFYQKHLSHLKGEATCRFSPTCSQYAIDAFAEWGFFIGIGLTLYRIIRCNPFNPGGYDPVPKRK